MANVKEITVHIPNSRVLKLIKNTPALKRLFRGVLVVGENKQSVNHKQYFDITRIIKTIGCDVTE